MTGLCFRLLIGIHPHGKKQVLGRPLESTHHAATEDDCHLKMGTVHLMCRQEGVLA